MNDYYLCYTYGTIYYDIHKVKAVQDKNHFLLMLPFEGGLTTNRVEQKKKIVQRLLFYVQMLGKYITGNGTGNKEHI